MILSFGVSICFLGFKLIIFSSISFPNSSFKVIIGLNSLLILLLLFAILNPGIFPFIFILELMSDFGIFILKPGIFPYISILESTLRFGISNLISGIFSFISACIFPLISAFGKLNLGFDILILAEGNLILLFNSIVPDAISLSFPHNVGFITFKLISSFMSSVHNCFNVIDEISILSFFILGIFNLAFISGFEIIKFPLRFGSSISKLGILKFKSSFK